jgi:hypothetical protein
MKKHNEYLAGMPNTMLDEKVFGRDFFALALDVFLPVESTADMPSFQCNAVM